MGKQSKEIHIRARNLDDVANIMQDVEYGYKGLFVQKTAEALVLYLKLAEPEYSYKSRAAAYGLTGAGTDWGNMKPIPGYFSRKQFRFVMAGISQGTITPGTSQRTGKTQEGWNVQGSGTRAVIVNKTPGATWTQNDTWQARQPALVGWQKAGDTIEQNIDDAMVDGIDAVLEAVKQKRG